MLDRRTVIVALAAAALAVWTNCGSTSQRMAAQIPQRNGPLMWDVTTPRDLSYELIVRSGFQDLPVEESQSILHVYFVGDGLVQIRVEGENGKEDLGKFSITQQGVLRPEGESTVPIYLGMLSLLPEGGEVGPGQTWVRLFPDGDESELSKVVYRSELEGSVASVESTLITARLVGRGRLLGNEGLRRFVNDYWGEKPRQEVQGIFEHFSTPHNYLSGSLTFDSKRGHLVSVDTQYVRFPLSRLTPSEIAESPEREEMSIRLQR